MTARATAILVVGALTACTYYNSIYNAHRTFEAAERDRTAGRDSLAGARYREVVSKAAKGFRREPEGEWADDALLLMGRAYFRRGQLRAARAALRQAGAAADGEQARLSARMYLGAVRVALGDAGGGSALLNEALRGLEPGEIRGEGHLWRARVLMEDAQVESGWWDLDRAAESHARPRLEAAVERVRWGVRYEDLSLTREGVRILMGISEGGARRDTVLALVRTAGERWGPGVAAGLLRSADSSRWPRAERDEARLARAELRRAAGDSAGGILDARAVASGVGASAAAARMLLARWLLEGAAQIEDLGQAIAVLLPVEHDARAAELLRTVRGVESLARAAASEPVAGFIAAETAWHELGAGRLARGLYLFFADVEAESPWSGKSLLAALHLASSDRERAQLRLRLERMEGNPYVLAARGEASPRIPLLEEDLAVRIRDVVQRLAPELGEPRAPGRSADRRRQGESHQS